MLVGLVCMMSALLWSAEHYLALTGLFPSLISILAGFSELFAPRPGFWPKSIHVCGFWVPRPEWWVRLRAVLTKTVQCWATAATGYPHPWIGCLLLSL